MIFPKRISTLDVSKVPTPCYVIEEELLDYNLNILDYVQKESGAKILLALKAFALWKSFGSLKKTLHGACASGLYEARLAREEINREVHVYSPAFKDEEFEEILTYADHLVFNSSTQLNRFIEKVKASNREISVGLRVNPEHSEVKHEIYDPSANGSRLGITIDEFNEGDLGLIDGLHFHAMCEQGADVLERVLESFEQKFGKYIDKLKWINFGGGHWITQDGYDIQLLIKIIKSFKEKYPNIEVYLEPGEAVALKSGVLVASVLDVLQKKSGNIVLFDGSIDAHMPDCIIMPYDPEIRGAGAGPEYVYEYRFGGGTCLQGDKTNRTYLFKEPLKVGDKIIFEDMIHYTIVKNTTFNGVKLPSIAIWKKSGELEILRSFGYEEYKNRNS